LCLPHGRRRCRHAAHLPAIGTAAAQASGFHRGRQHAPAYQRHKDSQKKSFHKTSVAACILDAGAPPGSAPAHISTVDKKRQPVNTNTSMCARVPMMDLGPLYAFCKLGRASARRRIPHRSSMNK
jgi:hypothetical protein